MIDLTAKPKEPENIITGGMPMSPMSPVPSPNDPFHSRGNTKGGFRNMQDSSFALSGRFISVNTVKPVY